MDNEKKIAEVYKEFYDLAQTITEKEMLEYVSPDRTELKRRHMTAEEAKFNYKELVRVKQIKRMMAMFRDRYGDVDQRARIVNYIKKNLILTELQESNWAEVEKQILSGEYKDLNDIENLQV